MAKRVAVFIDAANLWQLQKAKGQVLDMAKLQAYLKDRYKADTIQVFYYDAYPAQDTRSYSIDGKFRFYTMLEKKLGMIVRKKPLKQIHSADSKHEDGMVEKGNMDVELAIDAVRYVDDYDTALLFSGDSDFLAIIKFIRERGKKAYIFSTKNHVSSELRTGGDGYIDLLAVQEDIWRGEVRYRAQRS